MSTDKIPTYCLQCVCGPDLLKVTVDEDDEPIGIEPNYDAADVHPACGRVCSKAYTLIGKENNPNRIEHPMVRTNPEKGWDEDPQWEEISWEEAIGLLAEKLDEAQAGGGTDENGYPNVAVTMGAAGIPEGHYGTFPAVLGSLDGHIDFSLGSGQGVVCYHSEHIYGELWHRAYLGVPDVEHTEYVVSFGANKQNTAGPSGNWQYSAAKSDGATFVQVEPTVTTSGGWADEWIPIKPKTDAVFLYAMLHVALHERDWAAETDTDFLRERTNSPYLVTDDGYFLRDPETEKPLVWDAATGDPVPIDAGASEPALTGSYEAAGVEVRADDETREYEGAVSPSFQNLLDHAAEPTPEAAAEVCDVPAETIRRIGNEFADTASEYVGNTIEIEGTELPHRPVGILLGKGVNNGWGGYQCVWARTVLCMLYGAIEVPGGLISIGSRLNRPFHNKQEAVEPGADGFMAQSLSSTKPGEWPEEPRTRGGLTALTPHAGSDGWAQSISPSTLAWKFLNEAPENWPEPSNPDVWLVYRANPVTSHPDTDLITDVIEDFPFTVSIGYTIDETNWFADLILPDNIDLESLQLKQIGGHSHAMDSFWDHYGYALKQPVTDPTQDTIELTELWTELMDDIGRLERYNTAINRGYVTGKPLETDDYDFSLDPAEKHEYEEIWDRLCKAATADLTDNEAVKDLEWFKEHGFYTEPFPETNHYLHHRMEAEDIRYELPYQERLMRMGAELERRLDERGVDWWDDQLEEYEALPANENPAAVWEEAYGEDRRFWALTSKSMHYAYGSNASIELSAEMARLSEEFEGVCIHPSAAEDVGVEPGDTIRLTSPHGEVEGPVITREGVRPDTALLIGQFGHSVTPLAKNLRIPNVCDLTSVDDFDLIDGTGSVTQLAKVDIEPVD